MSMSRRDLGGLPPCPPSPQPSVPCQHFPAPTWSRTWSLRAVLSLPPAPSRGRAPISIVPIGAACDQPTRRAFQESLNVLRVALWGASLSHTEPSLTSVALTSLCILTGNGGGILSPVPHPPNCLSPKKALSSCQVDGDLWVVIIS